MHPLFHSIGAPDVPSHAVATFQSNPSPRSYPRKTSSRILNTWKQSLSPCRRTRSRTGTPSTSACHRWSSRARRSETPFFLRPAGLTDGREIASDDEFTLFGVVVFRRVHDEFQQKCRENKYARESVSCPCTTDVGRKGSSCATSRGQTTSSRSRRRSSRPRTPQKRSSGCAPPRLRARMHGC
jgi:hypothetical protein